MRPRLASNVVYWVRNRWRAVEKSRAWQFAQDCLSHTMGTRGSRITKSSRRPVEKVAKGLVDLNRSAS